MHYNDIYKIWKWVHTLRRERTSESNVSNQLVRVSLPQINRARVFTTPDYQQLMVDSSCMQYFHIFQSIFLLYFS